MIRERVREILQSLPEGVILLAATKGRGVDEIIEAVDAGVRVIGENYVQEAFDKYSKLGKEINGHRVEWHFIGHLQRNKVKRACEIFDMIQSVDSVKIAREIDRRCGERGIIMPVLIEVNSGREPNKAGVMPEDVLPLATEIYPLEHLRLAGVMTMGPRVENPEDIRPFFQITRGVFLELRREFGDDIRYLSMGMTDTWRIAVEEGANIVRVGRGIFGPR